jgi:hypothetical protein
MCRYGWVSSSSHELECRCLVDEDVGTDALKKLVDSTGYANSSVRLVYGISAPKVQRFRIAARIRRHLSPLIAAGLRAPRRWHSRLGGTR